MEKLNPKAVWIFFFKFLAIGLFLAVLLGYFFLILIFDRVIKFGFGWRIIILLVVVIWLCGSYGWAKLTYRFYRYKLTEDAFCKEKGVIWKKYVTIPYDRIQNVDIYRGILARILGLSDLHIQTAGMSSSADYGGWGSEAEGRLPGLSQQIAQELRDELIRRARKPKNQGL